MYGLLLLSDDYMTRQTIVSVIFFHQRWCSFNLILYKWIIYTYMILDLFKELNLFKWLFQCIVLFFRQLSNTKPFLSLPESLVAIYICYIYLGFLANLAKVIYIISIVLIRYCQALGRIKKNDIFIVVPHLIIGIYEMHKEHHK